MSGNLVTPEEKLLFHVGNNDYFKTVAIWRVMSEKTEKAFGEMWEDGKEAEKVNDVRQGRGQEASTIREMVGKGVNSKSRTGGEIPAEKGVIEVRERRNQTKMKEGKMKASLRTLFLSFLAVIVMGMGTYARAEYAAAGESGCAGRGGATRRV